MPEAEPYRPAEAAVVRADPDAALAAGPFPLLVDECQVVPEVLGAVKRAVDEGAAAGSFVLTGSSRADLTAAGWPATGRLIRVLMYGLAERELEHGSSRPPVLDRLVTEGAGGHLFHVRDANGRPEVDILVELGDGRVIGIEIKADSAPGPDAARHLRWLREAIGSRFALGLVLHTGPRSFRLDRSIAAWSPLVYRQPSAGATWVRMLSMTWVL